MKQFAWLGLLTASLLSTPLVANDHLEPGAAGAVANRFYISPMGSHTWADSDRLLDDSFGGALSIGKQINSTLMLELTGFYTEFDSEINLENDEFAEIIGYGANALIFATPNIFGILGVAGGNVNAHPSTGDTDYETLITDVGLGVLFGPFDLLASGMSVRAEARYRVDHHDEPDLGGALEERFGDAVVNLGLLIPIGAQPAPPPEPEPVVVVAPEPPADTDGDGVTDDLDQCPGTPAGTPVDEVGCPIEPDPPGCETPEPGQPVTLDGCAAGDTVVLRGVNFNFDQSTLTPNAQVILDGVGDAMLAVPSVAVEVEGHTDALGTDEYNQKLSERRAESVIQYLVGRGVEADRMKPMGYGESQPVADNETEEGRALNRRVELQVVNGDDGHRADDAVDTDAEAEAALSEAIAEEESEVEISE